MKSRGGDRFEPQAAEDCRGRRTIRCRSITELAVAVPAPAVRGTVRRDSARVGVADRDAGERRAVDVLGWKRRRDRVAVAKLTKRVRPPTFGCAAYVKGALEAH